MSVGTETGTKPEIIRRAFKGTIDDVDAKKRTVTAIVTTDAIDRMREVISPKGIALENFQANPVVLWCHKSGDPPIGKSLWIKRSGTKRGLIARTLFAKTDRGEEIFQLYVDGFLNGWSIGARPNWKTYSPPTPDEIKARPELRECAAIIRQCELIEYSAVSIPANPEALGNELGKSISRSLLEEILAADRWEPTTKAAEDADEREKEQDEQPARIELPPLVGRTLAEVIEARRLAIRSMTGAEAIKRAFAEQVDRAKGRV